MPSVAKNRRSHYIFNVAIPTNDKYGLIHNFGYSGHYQYKNYKITWLRTSLEIQIWATDTKTSDIFVSKTAPIDYTKIDEVYSLIRIQTIRRIKSDLKSKQRGTL